MGSSYAHLLLKPVESTHVYPTLDLSDIFEGNKQVGTISGVRVLKVSSSHVHVMIPSV